MPVAAPPATRATTLGTPCARAWTDDWIAQVDTCETALGRRVCGARAVGGTPCPLPSDHASGRCKHHGGFSLTGAPTGNQNALIHSLYSRRLMVCGPHCPSWQTCPLGGGSIPPAPEPTRKPGPRPVFQNGVITAVDIPKLEPMKTEPPAKSDVISYGQQLANLPLAQRPLCPYEQAEYDAVLANTGKSLYDGKAYADHMPHMVALLTVMVSRAGRALATGTLTETTHQSGEHYSATFERPSAALAAFEKLTRELRRWLHVLGDFSDPRCTRRREPEDTISDPDLGPLNYTLRDHEDANITPATAHATDGALQSTSAAPVLSSPRNRGPLDEHAPRTSTESSGPQPTETMPQPIQRLINVFDARHAQLANAPP